MMGILEILEDLRMKPRKKRGEKKPHWVVERRSLGGPSAVAPVWKGVFFLSCNLLFGFFLVFPFIYLLHRICEC
ncbi:hypothetical protein B296_00048259 [Ensete ventricosum]|uniref:Uncharacterized protein n=1 Tax=Ensete ventricosum TaxID=4639 RepID=A0A426Y9P8_ENSVE|nr:hypothetical protein B296_00048259 [Ensete ventricosum]